ncbi:chloramphenicol phosphotransferase CPT family protein [Cognatishimia sp. MH4019]|uniref:chloramphenicol phosphotransferase CPT family protein n=1 Tax=Cognatishimia sp. MH4019 TaxID=2854030 RepID=UPI001CD38C8E|nr:AAA family ATPase [Cognatishimia sp. MH4019]
MTGQIIILHGPSSSGKSTTAKAIQQLVEFPFWHISTDHLRDSGVLPTDRIKRQEFHWCDLRKPFFNGFHASLAAYANAGNNLIVEHILDTPEWVHELKNLLAPFDVFFVGLHCSLDELKIREQARGDRPVGSAEQDYYTVHFGRVYDIEVNGQASVEENAQAILECWRSGFRQSEFAAKKRVRA